MLILLVPVLLLLAGCSTEPVLMRNSIGQTVQCGPYPKTLLADRLVVNDRERGCIMDYQRQGYERVMR